MKRIPNISVVLRLGLGLTFTAAAAGSPVLAAGAPSGAQIYARCAACHTATGAGVPGAYPPLGADFKTQAATPAGRRYLALAVIKGLMGPLTVDGRTYRGVMPAQSGLNDEAVASVLNHVGKVIAKAGPSFRAFTAAEIGAARKSGAKLTAADVAKLHP